MISVIVAAGKPPCFGLSGLGNVVSAILDMDLDTLVTTRPSAFANRTRRTLHYM
jgi:hypothetical protein